MLFYIIRQTIIQDSPCIIYIQGSDFFMNMDSGTCGKLYKGEKRKMCDFALKLTALVQAGEMTGYFCEVKREIDQEKRYKSPRNSIIILDCTPYYFCSYSQDYFISLVRECFFTTDAANQKLKFVSQLSKSFGSGGGFTCAFNDTDLTRFIQFLKRSQATTIKIRKGITVVGKQPNSDVWVLNATTQVRSSGEVVLPTQSEFVVDTYLYNDTM